MVFKINYDGNVEEIKTAYANCEKATLDASNSMLAKIIAKTMSVEDAKESVVTIVKLARNLGALEVYKSIVDGTLEEVDTNE